MLNQFDEYQLKNINYLADFLLRGIATESRMNTEISNTLC